MRSVKSAKPFTQTPLIAVLGDVALINSVVVVRCARKADVALAELAVVVVPALAVWPPCAETEGLAGEVRLLPHQTPVIHEGDPGMHTANRTVYAADARKRPTMALIGSVVAMPGPGRTVRWPKEALRLMMGACARTMTCPTAMLRCSTSALSAELRICSAPGAGRWRLRCWLWE